MEWLEDARRAREGDEDARARLADYLGPFLHGVLISHAAHHHATAELPRVLAEVLATLPRTPPPRVGAMALACARDHAERLALSRQPEQPAPRQDVTAGRQVLARLRALPEGPRERLVLRLVEGIPGPEQAQVGQEPEARVREDLERGAAELARLLGLPAGGREWLWDGAVEPPPGLARLETQLSALRYDPASEASQTLDSSFGATWSDLSFPGASTPSRAAPDDLGPGSAAHAHTTQNEIPLPGHAGSDWRTLDRLLARGGAPGADAAADADEAHGGSVSDLTAAEVAGPTMQVVDVPVAAQQARGAPAHQLRLRQEGTPTDPPGSPASPSEPTLGPVPAAGSSEPTLASVPTPRAPPDAPPPLRTSARPALRRGVTEREVRAFTPPRSRAWLAAVALSGLLGALVTAGAWRWWSGPAAAPRMLVAAKDLEAGALLSPADLASAPVRAVPPPPELLTPDDAPRVAGARLAHAVARGAPLLAPVLSARPEGRLKAIRLVAPPGLEGQRRVDVRVLRPAGRRGPALAGRIARDVAILWLPEGATPRRAGANATPALLLDVASADVIEEALRLGKLELLPTSGADGPDADGARLLAEATAQAQQRRRALALGALRGH